MPISKATRISIARQAHGSCEYCMTQEALDNKSFSLDHIRPISLGGSDALENLAFCCQGCNSIKYNRMNGIDPETGELLPLFNPRKDKWTTHFRWNENFTVVFGTTPIGRATVATLQLNRMQLINQRVVFSIAQVHPPAHSIA